MEYVFSFEKLNAYQEARKLVSSIYIMLRSYPQEERYALCDQMRRAAVSITSNIAEGTSRSSVKDKAHFMEIAFGSAMELYSQIQVSLDLGYINEVSYNSIRHQIVTVSKLLSGLKASFLREASH